MRSEGGPSRAAIEAVDRASREGRVRYEDYGIPGLLGYEDMLNAAHDPALGLDRSVCLRDIVEALRKHDLPEGHEYRWLHIAYATEMDDAADFIEHEFGSR